MKHLHFDSVDSTMEAARREASASPGNDFLLVTSEVQTGGRGTRGRPWHSPRGNIYLTIAIPRTLISSDRLSLFPLETGLALWESTAALLPPAARDGLRLKWPNDLLWEGRKAAGMLLEATSEHLFVGVGINLVEAPEVVDGGTPSARLSDAGIGEDAGLALAKSFSGNLRDLLMLPALGGARNTVEEWRARALWTKSLRLRDRPARPEVYPVDLNAEGHLKVRFADGREEWLVSEYLA